MLRQETLYENIRVGLDALRIHPVRTLLSVLGILIGSGSLVATMAVSDGMVAFARRTIERETPIQVVTVSPRTAKRVDGEWVPVRGWPEFTEHDAALIAAQVPGVRMAAVALGGRATVRHRGVHHAAGLTLGSASLQEFGTTELAAGRMFAPVESSGGASVVVLSHELARDLSPTHDPLAMLGTVVHVRGRAQRVIGVLAAPLVMNAEEPNYQVLAPLRSAGALTDARPDGRRTPVIQLLAASVEQVPDVQAAVEDWFARHDPEWQEQVRVAVRLDELKQVEQAFALLTLFVGALVSISLLVGGIGIMNVLLASVAERTREIGIRKAVGAKRNDILQQFLAESVAIALVGSTAGLVIGFLGAMLVTAVFRALTHAPVTPVLTLTAVLVATISSSVVGLVFGTYPAQRAAALPPVAAIAQE